MPSSARLFRRIVHASDFSPASRRAFATALSLARGSRASLTIVHVLSAVMPIASEGFVLPEAYEQIEASARAQAQKQLDRLVARARTAGVQAVGLLRHGVAHEEITRTAKARRADLLVIGTHGRTGLARMFLGSVAARVVTVATCPVLTVRGG